ncbi:LysR family transcriptional regulator [Vibrio astriarenae]|uniref:LysR family transcriptional regulator n=1 Tax=Vibrio astriarenae TaxID=1481923 RepID=UPI0037360897
MDDIANHRVLICVADSGSLGMAAEQLGKSKVMISRAIKALENELGFRLLDRNAKGSKLTAKGKAYVDSCRPILMEVDTALRVMTINKLHFTKDTTEQQIKLKLSSPNTFGSIVLSEVIADFQKENPNYVIELVTDEQFQDIFDHQLDISIRAHLSSDSIHENLISRPLIKLPFFLCCSPGFVQANGLPKSLDSLFSNFPFVAWSYLNQEDLVMVDSETQRKCHSDNVKFVSNNSLSCFHYLKSANAFACLPYHVIRQALKEDALVVLSPEHSRFEVDLRITYLNAQGTQSATNVFVDYLVEHPSILELKREIHAIYSKLAI